MCAELADLGMQLARAAAARARADLAEHPAQAAPQPPATPAMAPQSYPVTAAHPDPAPAAPCRAAAIRPCKQIDPALLFTRLATVVRNCIALEARLAGTAPAAPTEDRARLLRADPRRPLIRDALKRALEKHPDRAELNRETTARLDEQLAADADQITHPGRLFFALCDAFSIEINVAILPDELLYANPEPAHLYDHVTTAPAPRATSPP